MSKVVLITGAGSGIGKETAIYLASIGHHMVLTDNDLSKITSIQNEINTEGGNAVSFELDVRNESDFKNALDFTLKNYSTLDVWINNAGIMPTGHFLQMPDQQDLDLLNINLHGTVRGMRTALTYFKSKGSGHVINIASITAKVPLPYASMYSASKSAILNLCDALRVELESENIDISCVLPGTVNTPLVSSMKPTLFPPVISPTKVARAIAKLIIRPKARKFLPWYLGSMSLAQDFLPTFLIIKMGKLLKITDSVKPNS